MFRENRLKRKIAADEAVYGFWLGLGDPALAEMASAAGYDFVIIDNEHGQQTYAQTLDLMRAARAGDATVMVRPSGQHADEIKRLMDMGAEALMVPMIQSAGEAEAMVAAALYPPAGIRGYAAPGVRASGYGMVAEYAARANDELFSWPRSKPARRLTMLPPSPAWRESICCFWGLATCRRPPAIWTL